MSKVSSSPVVRARQARDTAARAFEQAVLQRYRDGYTISRIAVEAGWSRQAVYNLLRRRHAGPRQ